MESSVCVICVCDFDIKTRFGLVNHFSINSSNDRQFSVNRTPLLLSQDMEKKSWCDQIKKTKDRKVMENRDWSTKRKIYKVQRRGRTT